MVRATEQAGWGHAMEIDRGWLSAALDARETHAPYPLAEPTDLDEAYAMQGAYAAAVAARKGGVSGYKLAANSPRLLAHFGVSEPVWARIFRDETHLSGLRLPRAGFGDLFVEPELAAILGPGVAGLTGPVDRDGALALIERYHGAIELVDANGAAMHSLALAQAVTLNVFNAGIVLGEVGQSPATLDLPTLSVTLRIDGEVVGEATGAAPQDPVEAVRFVVNDALRRGAALSPGMVVMCGTHLPMRRIAPGETEVAVDMSGLGRTVFTLTD